MKRSIIFLSIFILIFSASNFAFSEDIIKAIEGINENQPISVGETIYEENVQAVNDSSYAFYRIKYTYIGFDNNSIQIPDIIRRDN